MTHRRLRDLSRPSTGACCPFFIVEFKSGSRGGTRWVAQNQNAASGCHSVNCLEKLLAYSQKPRGKDNIIDSLVFSCVVEADQSSLWVHWYEPAAGETFPRFLSAEIGFYLLKKFEDLRRFHHDIRIVFDYGLNQRLQQIKTVRVRRI